ncbi:MAG: aspartate aminotransferase family protein, partial [Candidatus Aminicenantes bacterium]|nr:aspartate aminotransferase family protein [Candidatus Aminicenantes bacterium]
RSMNMTSAAEKIKNDILLKYHERNKISKKHNARAKRFLPGGDTRNVCFHQPYPTYIEKGSGCRVWDVDGNEYLDFVNNYTALIHGHAHPNIVEAVKSQLAKGTIFGAPAECQYKLAEHLIERIPALDLIRFSNSGTEATLFAMRAARCFTGRDLIIKMNGGYHGTHDYSWINVIHPDIGNRKIPQTIPEYGVPSSVLRDTLIAHFNDLAGFETLLKKNNKRIAGVILAPVLASNTIIAPIEGYLQRMRSLCDRYDILLIFDEVITLRLSRGGMQEISGVKPDLTTLGKIIGGGFPIGAFGGKREVMEQFHPEHPKNVMHSGTFNGNSISMAAGLAALKMFDRKEINRVNSLGDRLKEGFKAAVKSAGFKSNVLNTGSLVSFLWRDTRIRDVRDAARAIESTAVLNRYLHLELLNRGIFVAPREFYSVSTAMSDNEIDQAVGIFWETLEYLKPLVSEIHPDLIAN